MLARGGLVSGADYVQAQRMRAVAQDAIARLFDGVDVVACPTAATGDTVRALLAAAGLLASDAEVASLVTAYPAIRACTDALYREPAARYADPALRFRATARIINWW